VSYETHEFYCMKCHCLTPHEYDDETRRSQCIPCLERGPTVSTPQARNPHAFVNEPWNTRAFISALDGFGNRGEGRRTHK
jgi:hypothetical protein